MPLTKGDLCDKDQEFDWDGLASVLTTRVEEARLELHWNFSVMDISLVTAKTPCPDRHDLSRELAYAEKHSDKLEVLNWVMLGERRAPKDLSPERLKMMALNLPQWQVRSPKPY